MKRRKLLLSARLLDPVGRNCIAAAPGKMFFWGRGLRDGSANSVLHGVAIDDHSPVLAKYAKRKRIHNIRTDNERCAALAVQAFTTRDHRSALNTNIRQLCPATHRSMAS